MAAWTLTKNGFSGDKIWGGMKAGGALSKLDATITTGSDTYATGGHVFSELATYFDTIKSVEVMNANGRWSAKWDGGTVAAGKVIVYSEDQTSGVNAQVGNGTNLATTPGTLRVRVTGTMLSTYKNAAYASGNGVQ